jgi:hypothetical protein
MNGNEAKQHTLDQLSEVYTRLFNVKAGMDDIRDPAATAELNAQAWDALKDAIWMVANLATFGPYRKVSNRELADLPAAWENPKVDTRKYYQCAMAAWEVDKATYENYKHDGGLCQKHKGRYYIA